MSRNTTPSVLSTLTAYDNSSGSSDDEEDPVAKDAEQTGQVTLLLPPAAPPVSAPNSREPSPVPPPRTTMKGLIHAYGAEEEENFDFHVEHAEEEEGGSLHPDLLVPTNSSKVSPSSPSNNGDDDKNTDAADSDPTPAKRRRLLDSLLPPPDGKCAPELDAKFARMLALKEKGRHANDIIQNMKGFRNPSIYEKFIIMCGIDEQGTNFPDQPKYKPEDFYDELYKAQALEMERRFKEKEKLKKAKEQQDIARAPLNLANIINPPGVVRPTATIKAFGNLTFKN